MILTFIVGTALFVPLAYAAIKAAHEAQFVVQWLAAAQRQGVPPPFWLGKLPLGSSAALEWWDGHLGHPTAASDLLRHIDVGGIAAWTSRLGAVLHRFVILGLALLSLFFLYRDGQSLASAILMLSRRLWGELGERYVLSTGAALRATVNGQVLVAVAEAVLFTIAYILAGVENAVLVGTLTGLFSMIPLVAPVIYGSIALILYAQGSIVTGLALLIFCTAVMFIADNFVRPVLIGNTGRLPFLWVLLGILGGLETLGLIGLFLGPALMAVLVALWRDVTAETLAGNDVEQPP